MDIIRSTFLLSNFLLRFLIWHNIDYDSINTFFIIFQRKLIDSLSFFFLKRILGLHLYFVITQILCLFLFFLFWATLRYWKLFFCLKLSKMKCSILFLWIIVSHNCDDLFHYSLVTWKSRNISKMTESLRYFL